MSLSLNFNQDSLSNETVFLIGNRSIKHQYLIVYDRLEGRARTNNSKTFPCNIQTFKIVKNENFQWKFLDIFLIFVQNIDYGYKLEPPR